MTNIMLTETKHAVYHMVYHMVERYTSLKYNKCYFPDFHHFLK